MVPSLLFDISGIDMDRLQYDAEAVERINPHRGDMRMLDGVIYMDEGHTRAVAFKDVREDEFWVPGHIPGRPLLPGVLMIEAAAQLASVLTKHYLPEGEQDAFVGFVGVEKVKFRGQVEPGDRLIVLSKVLEFRRRRTVCASQGLVRGGLVFEATITGMLI